MIAIQFEQFAFVWFAVFGAVVGSFLNAVVYRVPRGYLLSLPRRSFCPQCKHQLRWYENLPILSYLVQLGRCRNCKKSIGLRYFSVELLTATLFVAVFQIFGLSFDSIYYCIFVAMLVAITFIDIDFRIIPDKISYLGMIFGFIGSFWIPRLTWMDSLLGFVIGGGFFWLLSWGYEKIRRREGLGFGDVKLIAMIGAFLGIKGVIATIFLSSIVGSFIGITLMVVQRKNLKMAIPFGPFLAIGALIFLFWGDDLIVRFYPMGM